MSIRVFLVLFLLLIFITFQIGFAQPSASWVEVGAGSATFPGGVGPNDNAQWPSLAIAPDGTSYVAYSAYVDYQNEVYVRKFDGTSWVEVGAGSASGGGISNDSYDSNFVRIAIARDGTPYVLWQSRTATTGNIYIKRFDGASWVEVGVGSATGGGISNSTDLAQLPVLAVAPNGTVYAAWNEVTSGLYIKQFDGANWIEVGNGSASGDGLLGGYVFYASLDIGDDGLPLIAYPQNDDIYVRRFNGTEWVELRNGAAVTGGVSNTPSNSGRPSLTIAPDGTPYVAWIELLDGAWQIYVRRYNGTSWVEAGAGSASGNGITDYPLLQTPSYAGYPVLTVDAIGIVYAAWQYESQSTFTVIHARRYAGNTWEEIPIGSATGAGIISGNFRGFAPSLAIHPVTNLPYIAWFAAEFPPSWVIGVFVRRLEVIAPTPVSPTVTPVPLPLLLTTPGLSSGTVGGSYSQTLTASGGRPPYTFSIQRGVLPAGINLTSTGILSGTPTQSGSFMVALQVTDGTGLTASQMYTLVINAPATPMPVTALTLAPSSLPAGAAGVPYQAVISAQGGTGSGYTYAIIGGALPPGLSLNAFGVISGTPTQLGSTTFTIIALDSGGNTGSATFTLTIAPPDALAGH